MKEQPMATLGMVAVIGFVLGALWKKEDFGAGPLNGRTCPVVTIPHKLDKVDNLPARQSALGKASSSFPVLAVEEETWSGDRLSFRLPCPRTGSSRANVLEVAEDHVQLEVTLPWVPHEDGGRRCKRP